MEPYRLKDGTSQQKRKLLLPVSGGVSSLVLLQVLDFHIQRQLASRGRAAYGLEVLIVDTSCIGHIPSAADLVESLKEIFPSHHFTLLSLDTVFDIDHDLPSALSDLGFDGYMGEEPRAGLERLRLGLRDGLDFAPRPRWPLDPTSDDESRLTAAGAA